MDLLTRPAADPSHGIEDNLEKGVCRVDRSIFTDPELFELEMEQIWESSWVYLAHESQIPDANDYFTSWIGRQPVVLIRNGAGTIKAFINACSHRGATLIRDERGNREQFECPFHGWAFDTDGQLTTVAFEKTGGYPAQFCKAELGLTPVPRVESYRGFIFASLSDDVPTLREHLADAARIIDLMVDQAPEGLEVLPGRSVYTFDANWKMQAENGVDGYHVFATHANYVMTTEHRRQILADNDPIKAMRVGNINRSSEAGFFDFGHGHVLLYSAWPNPEDRPSWAQLERFTEQFGEERAQWMVGYLRNLLLYPNVFLMDQMSSQIRVFRPIAVDKTEVTIFCIAPVGESDDDRYHRLRQYEDFFNASGMATPDDLAEFGAAQRGAHGTSARWSDLTRGAEFVTQGANDAAKRLGIKPVTSGSELTAEGIMIAQHRYWLERMTTKE